MLGLCCRAAESHMHKLGCLEGPQWQGSDMCFRQRTQVDQLAAQPQDEQRGILAELSACGACLPQRQG